MRLVRKASDESSGVWDQSIHRTVYDGGKLEEFKTYREIFS